MRFLALLVLATGLAIPAASAQPEAAKSPGPTTSESAKTSDEYPQNELRGWQWANFILLLAILGYLGVRMGRPYFAGQTQTIRKDLEEARRRREEAERRMAEVQQKLNNLGAEIASFRQNVLAEQGVEADRMRKQAESDLIHVQQSASQQIETLGKHLRLELRRFASHLALELAEQRIRGRMTSDAQRRLNDRFIQDLRA